MRLTDAQNLKFVVLAAHYVEDYFTTTTGSFSFCLNGMLFPELLHVGLVPEVISENHYSTTTYTLSITQPTASKNQTDQRKRTNLDDDRDRDLLIVPGRSWSDLLESGCCLSTRS